MWIEDVWKKGPKKKYKRTRITSEILEKILNLRKRGLTDEEIAAQINITSQTVAKYVRKEGLGGRRKKVNREVLDRMDNLVKAGMRKKK